MTVGSVAGVAQPPAPAAARTVAGDVAARSLGRVDYHEHLFQASPRLPGDELDDERRSGVEAGLLRGSGFAAMVDATPVGLGRDPAAVARISASTGLAVVATTGAHRGVHYRPHHWILAASTGRLAATFRADIEVGMPAADRDDGHRGQLARGPDGGPVRAGMLKAGIGYWSITAFERRVLAAVAQAHRETGAPVMVHLEDGSAAAEVLDVLQDSGVEPSAVVLAHVDRNPDAGLHAELAAHGAYLGYDGPARHRRWPDSIVLSCLLDAASRGAADRLLLGGDVARRSRYAAYGGMPGLAYLGERFVPRLVAEGGPDLALAVLVSNPQRLLSCFHGVQTVP